MKTLFVMILATLSSAAGDTLMSRGMKQVGDVSAMGHQVWKILTMFTNPWVLLSVCCSSVYFFLYSSALSWADLSLAQPMNAMGFIFVALIARFLLHERISAFRWAGIIVIIFGVLLVSLDQRGAASSGGK